MKRVDADFQHEGKEDRRENDQGGCGFHERSDNEQENVGEKQNQDFVVCQGEYGFRHPLRDLLAGQEPGKNACRTDHQHDQSAGGAGSDEKWRQVPEVNVPINEQADEQGVESRDAGAFSGGEDTRKDAPKDNDGHQENQKGIDTDLDGLFKWGAFGFGVASPFCIKADEGHLKETEEYAGHKTGEEKGSNRDLTQDTVNDERD